MDSRSRVAARALLGVHGRRYPHGNRDINREPIRVSPRVRATPRWRYGTPIVAVTGRPIGDRRGDGQRLATVPCRAVRRWRPAAARWSTRRALHCRGVVPGWAMGLHLGQHGEWISYLATAISRWHAAADYDRGDRRTGPLVRTGWPVVRHRSGRRSEHHLDPRRERRSAGDVARIRLSAQVLTRRQEAVLLAALGSDDADM